MEWAGGSSRIRWVDSGGDVRLGGPIAEHPPGAVVVDRVPIGLFGGSPADRPKTWDDLAKASNADRLAIGDPRHDPIPLELAARWAEAEGLAVALERLGRLYAGSALIATGSSEALVGRGRADWAFSTRSGPPLAPVVELVEGASIEPSVRDRAKAERFLAFLRDRVPDPGSRPSSPEPRELLADLLGAALVDGRAGLAQGSPGLPPWPPASVRALRQREDGDGLVQLLAEQLVPDAEARTWLLQGWDEDGRVDERWLDSLANAAGGRLLREPRFRAWLRGEWTAWAHATASAADARESLP